MNTVYNGSAQTLSGVTADNLVANDTINTTAQVNGTDAGTYAYNVGADTLSITDADGNSMLGNYNILGITAGSLTIAKADVTVTVDGTKVYDGTTGMANSSFSYDIAYTNGGNGFNSGMVNVTDFVYNNKNVHTDQAATGSAALLNNAERNFNVSFNYQSSITARDLNVTANSMNTVYNGSAQTLSGVTADNLVANDTINTTAQVSGTDAGTYAYNVNADTLSITDADGNSMLGNYNILGITAGSLTVAAKPVEVIYVTAEPYEYNEANQADTVSAYYIDVNGDRIEVSLDWHGREFMIPGLYTVTAINTNSNYSFVNPNRTLIMTGLLPSSGPYCEGLYPGYFSTKPVLEAQLLINRVSDDTNWVDGNIYSLTFGQLVSNSMLRRFELDSTGVTAEDFRVSVDSLEYHPFEIDAPQQEISELIFADSNVSGPQAFHMGEELFINHAESDVSELFETRGETYSDAHEPIYVEQDHNGELSLQLMPFAAPAEIFRKPEAPASSFDLMELPEISNGALTALNFKSELDELLESVAGIS